MKSPFVFSANLCASDKSGLLYNATLTFVIPLVAHGVVFIELCVFESSVGAFIVPGSFATFTTFTQVIFTDHFCTLTVTSTKNQFVSLHLIT